VGDRRGQGWTWFNMAEISLKQKDYEDALTSLLSTRKIFEDIRYSEYKLVQKSIDQLKQVLSKDRFEKLVQQLTPRVDQLLSL
jgi:hypothetical protein